MKKKPGTEAAKKFAGSTALPPSHFLNLTVPEIDMALDEVLARDDDEADKEPAQDHHRDHFHLGL